MRTAPSASARLVAGIAAVLAASAGAQTGAAESFASSRVISAETHEAPKYVPPTRGAPAHRVAAGTRGGAAETTLEVLAPDHVGLTVSEQPVLYWFVSKPVTAPVQITLASPGNVKPVIEIELKPPIAAGIHAFRLADHGVKLAPEIEYDWSVAVVLDRAQRSKDLVSSATVRRVTPSPDLARAVAAGQDARTAAIHAAHGIWYDAIDALARAIARQPSDAAPRRSRAALLEQVGLAAAANFDRQGGG